MKKTWLKGRVRWFDAQAGRGIIQCEKGNLYSVHYSAIKTNKKWKILKENKNVKFTILNDPDYQIVKEVIS